ncbi:hypothetical protein EDD15DRAFT_2524568 [Pisolithus albus]|nr:hypothetical protein EDD15DRAFT_2524568 [Pisolithus albus]
MPLAASAHLSHPGSQAPVQAVSSKFDTLQSTTPTETRRTNQLHDTRDLSPYMRWLENIKMAMVFVKHNLHPRHLTLPTLPLQYFATGCPCERYFKRLPTREIFRGRPYMRYFEPHGLLAFDVPHSPVVVRVPDPAMARHLLQECICLEWSQL